MARSLDIEGTQGDATLRSVMNWDDVETKKDVLTHWQKLGQFRNNHPAVGAGKHKVISTLPFTFSRVYSSGDYQDEIIVSFVDPDAENEIEVSSVFADGTMLVDAYSDQEVTVKNGTVALKTGFEIVLLASKN